MRNDSAYYMVRRLVAARHLGERRHVYLLRPEFNIRRHLMSYMNEPAFCGIDVAFAKQKLLPVCVCVQRSGALEPLPLRGASRFAPPRGAGNRRALDDACVEAFADNAAAYLHAVEREFGVSIQRIAIDAPRDYAPDGGRRASELAMDTLRISCFATPSRRRFTDIRSAAHDHLAHGGTEATLPYANQLWMLVSFALFRRLETEFECLEVFPNAIVRTLDSAVGHKLTLAGFERQIALISTATGWPSDASRVRLDQVGYGSRHDKLDAFMGAWIASLPPDRRIAHGDGAHDTIWVPGT